MSDVHWLGQFADTAQTMNVGAPMTASGEPQQLWRVDTERERGPLMPLGLVDGLLVETGKSASKKNLCRATDLESGAERWRVERDDRMGRVAGVVDGRVLIPPHLVALDGSGVAATLEFLPDRLHSSPWVHVGHYLFEDRDSDKKSLLRCFHLADGREIGTGIGGFVPRSLLRIPMAAGDGHLVYGTDDFRLVAVTFPGFERVWEARMPRMSYRGPVFRLIVGGARVFASTAPDAVICLDLATGQEAWRSAGLSADEPREVDDTCLQHLAFDGERLFLSGGRNGHGRVLCLDTASGTERWRFECAHPRGYVSPLVCAAGHVYGETDGKATAWDADSGAVAWQRPGVDNAGQVALGFGKLLLLGAVGETVCYRVGS